MKNYRFSRKTAFSALLVAMLISSVFADDDDDHGSFKPVGGNQNGRSLLPTGFYITPTAAPGAIFQQITTGLRADGNADANGAVTSLLSPDGRTLLVLTSGYNSGFATESGQTIQFPFLDPTTGQASTSMATSFQWVFVYDVSNGQPVKTQQIGLSNTFNGLAWDPSGSRFYVSGGPDDRVFIYKQSSAGWIPDAPFIVLNHNSNGTQPVPGYDGGIFKNTIAGQSSAGQQLGINFSAVTAGIAVSADGKNLFAANLQNDSLSIVNLETRKVVQEVQLFVPGSTIPKGEFPFWITPHSGPDGKADKIFVTSLRDGQIISIALSGAGSYIKPGAEKVIHVGGEPAKMILSQNENRLYVANPDLDEIEVVDTKEDELIGRISVKRADYRYRGASPNSLAISRDGKTIYTTLAGENALGLVDVESRSVSGRIPTGWYPSSVTVSADGTHLFILNTKSNSGPNLAESSTPAGTATDTNYKNEYVYGLEKAGVLTLPIPNGSTLAHLSRIVDRNNHFFRDCSPSPMMAYLHNKIKHVIYIMRENRTYDQILGDLPVGNGDPTIALYPEAITPNAHALARQFVDLDNFYVPGDVSGDGWNWTVEGQANDYTNKSVPVDYAGGGFDFEWNAYVRNENLALPLKSGNPGPATVRISTLLDPSGRSTIQPGPKNVATTWGADDERPDQTGGYIWDSVLRAGLSVRHYGLWEDELYYSPGTPYYLPIVRDAAAKKSVQGIASTVALVGRTDPYFRGWDLNVPDEYRYEEWKREFDQYVQKGDLPALQVVCLMMDHTGSFSTNVGNLNTPELQVASNDHALGQLVDAVSHSPYWKDTAIFVVEDDAQDGPDHIDSHRSPGFVISAYTKRNKVVSDFYNTDSILRTIEDILGVNYLGLNDANSKSMDAVFQTTPDLKPYTVIVPGNLLQSPVDPSLVLDRNNPRMEKTKAVALRHDGNWWAQQTNKMNFTKADMIDAAAYNRLLWRGIKGENVPYPSSEVRISKTENRDTETE